MTDGARELQSRLAAVRERIRRAAERSNRSPDEITLVAVSKTQPAELITKAIGLGVTDLGENRVQEAEAKIIIVGRQAARWHLIGHLQTNKARRAVTLFDVIHSLDSIALAERLDHYCGAENRNELQVLVQLDLAGEATKSGIVPEALPELLVTIKRCSRLQLIGIMLVPPFFADTEQVRPYFRKLHVLRDELKAAGHFGDRRGELSMGMTHDFEVAIEEGATTVRIGTAIFGERHYEVSETV